MGCWMLGKFSALVFGPLAILLVCSSTRSRPPTPKQASEAWHQLEGAIFFHALRSILHFGKLLDSNSTTKYRSKRLGPGRVGTKLEVLSGAEIAGLS